MLEEIREQKKDTATTIVVASSLSDRSTVIDILKLGVEGYIVKPFTHKEIGRKILDSYRKTHSERADEALAVLKSEYEVPPSASMGG